MLYVLRRFWIQPGSFDKFERISRNEIWPPIEATGARVQGLWRADTSDPCPEASEPCQMSVLITGYVDRAHWRATRANAESWRGPEPLRRNQLAGSRARRELTIHTEPIFMEEASTRIGCPFRSWPDDWTPHVGDNSVAAAAPPAAGRPPLYALTRFWLPTDAFDRFAQMSCEGVWPAIEAMGARVRGLYRALDPQPNPEGEGESEMAALIVSYVDRPHWDAIHASTDEWRGPAALGSAVDAARTERRKLILSAHTTFMEPAHVPIGGPFPPALRE